MPVLKVQHSFQGASGVPADQYVNTFHLLVGSVEPDSFPDVAVAVRKFWTFEPGGSQHSIIWYMNGQADEPGERIKIYDMGDPIPRQPLYDVQYTPGTFGAGALPMPSEVACCLSYAAVPVGGIPLASTRGRIYIGPLNVSTMADDSVDAVSRPSLAFRTRLTERGVGLANDLATIDPVCIWVVHSETHNHNAGIVRFWADDAWDIQRRRGDPPTSRVTATI